MYVPDRDEVFRLSGIPQSSVGAPLPLLLATENIVSVSFYCENTLADWNGETVRSVDYTSDEPWAIVTFAGCDAHMFGPPNDEAFSGHPLYVRGLRPYGAYVVRDSSWLRDLERMNSVHPHHDRARFTCRA